MKVLLALVCLMSFSPVFAEEVKDIEMLTKAISDIEQKGMKCTENTTKIATKIQNCLLGDMFCSATEIYYCADSEGEIKLKVRAVYNLGYGQPTVLKKVVITGNSGNQAQKVIIRK